MSAQMRMACRLLRIDKPTIRRRGNGFHYGGKVGDVFKFKIGGELELVASSCLALRQSGGVAFVWRRIFFASGRNVALWFHRITMGLGHVGCAYGDGFCA